MLVADTPQTILLDQLQQGAFRYFDEYRSDTTGLIADASQPNIPASIAATGFGLSVLCLAAERGWLPRQTAAERVLTTLCFFSTSEQSRERAATGYRGLYYHFLDMETGKRAWRSELSLIDTALLLSGMLTAAAYFNEDRPEEREIRDLADMLYARANWAWALDSSDALVLGWKPRGGFLPYRWQGYSEAIILYALALGSRSYPVPPESYESFSRQCGWMDVDGEPFLYAGPLFIHLFSHAFIDFRGIQDAGMREKDSDYFINTQRAIAVHRDYAIRNPHGFTGYGSEVWGLTACDGPERPRRLRDGRQQAFSGYLARGAPFGPDDGTLAPWIAASCLPFAPEEALASLRHILAAYPGTVEDGGFIGSFNPSISGKDPEGWKNRRRIGLDQGLLIMMIENYRTGFFWQLMRSNTVLRRGLQRAGFSGGWL
ncbi:glucoamylase family protein [Rhizobium sp. YIM 134829]|uniref:glucoamylase family protein n=1 Tax=Rhizobium sp. YIM 134829 TaxID=3390453 RepID=UPI00397E1454